MDEYRPYPPEEPQEADDEQSQPESADTRDTARAAAPYADVEEVDQHDAAEETEEGEEAEGEASGQPGGRRGSRQERQAPDLEHPGGHLHGVVARLNRPRRFGFLRSDDGAEVFFHASALEAGPNAFDALRTGQEMEFDCHQDEQGRGLAATVVTIIGEPPERPPRPPRAERQERGEGGGRGERGGRQRGGSGWRVHVLTERGEQTVSQQLERLLNDRGVKPGNFTFNLTETDEGVECWVAVFNGNA